MPHAVLAGPIDLAAWWRGFSPILERGSDRVLKVEHCYLSEARTHALLAAFALEGGIRRKFLVHVGANAEGATVRLDALAEPDKSPGVRRIVALVAEDLRARTPGARIDRHNLDDVLGASS